MLIRPRLPIVKRLGSSHLEKGISPAHPGKAGRRFLGAGEGLSSQDTTGRNRSLVGQTDGCKQIFAITDVGFKILKRTLKNCALIYRKITGFSGHRFSYQRSQEVNSAEAVE